MMRLIAIPYGFIISADGKHERLVTYGDLRVQVLRVVGLQT